MIYGTCPRCNAKVSAYEEEGEVGICLSCGKKYKVDLDDAKELILDFNYSEKK